MDALFHIESQDQFKTAAEEILNNLYSSSKSVTTIENVITLAKDELKYLIATNNFDLANVKSTLQTKEWDSERIHWFISLLDEKSSELLYNTLLHHNISFGEAVVDFDWRLKMVLGTSELKTLKYPILQLLLTTNSANGLRQKMFELNKEMLKMLIDALEAAV